MRCHALLALAAGLALVGSAAAHCQHIVAKGETMYKIATDNDYNVTEVIEANPQANPEELAVGQVISLPCGGDDKSGKNLVDLLQHRTDTRLVLQAALAADLGDELAKLKGDTVFFPTDKAFEALLKELNMNETALLEDKELLAEVLLYHVTTDGAIAAKDLEAGATLSTLDAGDKTLEVAPSNKNGTASLKTAAGQEVELGEVDLRAGSNRVHMVEQVLLPFGGNAPAGAPAAKPAKEAKEAKPLPANCEHVVVKGDTLYELAQEYGTTQEELEKLNPVAAKDPKKIQVGDKLKVCGEPGPVASAAADVKEGAANAAGAVKESAADVKEGAANAADTVKEGAANAAGAVKEGAADVKDTVAGAVGAN